jgi:hypothetical protein
MVYGHWYKTDKFPDWKIYCLGFSDEFKAIKCMIFENGVFFSMGELDLSKHNFLEIPNEVIVLEK